MIDLDAITAAAAAELNVSDVATVRPFVDAAAAYVARWCNLPGGVPDLPGDDESLDRGVSLLAQRMFNDTPTPGGALDAFGELTGAQVPESLDRHLVDYWRHLQVAWGVA